MTLAGFYVPTLRGHLDLTLFVPQSICPSGNFVTKVEKWEHLCPMDTFLFFLIIKKKKKKEKENNCVNLC